MEAGHVSPGGLVPLHQLFDTLPKIEPITPETVMRVVAVLALTLATTMPAMAETARTDIGNAAVLQKLYPPRALAAGEQGVVGFEVALDKAGHPTSCQVVKSSGFPRLDAETCTVITQHAAFGTNAGVGSGSSTHRGEIAWTLPAGVAASTKTVAMNAVTDKIVCRRVPVTGSNARYERVCMSRAQWQESREDNKANYEELQGKGFKQGM